MPLPKVKNSPVFSADIPTLGKVKFRAMKVGQHKSLLTAIEMQDGDAATNTLLGVIRECTFGEVDVDKIDSYLVDLLYIKIHAKSHGNIAPVKYTCKNIVVKEEKEVPCGASYTLKLDLNNAEIITPKEHSGKKVIMVDDKVGITLRPPIFERAKEIKLQGTLIDITDSFVLAGIENIINGDEVMVPGVDMTADELVEWINDLDGSILTEMAEYFENIPFLGMKVPVTCPSCGFKETFVLRGLEDFLV